MMRYLTRSLFDHIGYLRDRRLIDLRTSARQPYGRDSPAEVVEDGSRHASSANAVLFVVYGISPLANLL